MARTTARGKKLFNPETILQPVKSSNVKAMGWKDNVMYVQFSKTDVIYQYKDVPFELYQGISCSASIGKNLHSSGLKGVKWGMPV